jgi:multiple sugar transport system permease protein
MSTQTSPLTLEAQKEAQKSLASRRRWDLLPYGLLLPSLLLIILINLYPFFTAVYYSLTDGTMLVNGQFVGLENYFRLLRQNDFLHSLWFSLIFAAFSVFGSYAVGLVFALILNQDIPGRGFFRVALLVPWIIPSIVSMVSWRWMIGDQTGLVNTIITALGFDPVYFLSTERLATFSVILVKIWRSFPFMMLSLLAGLQTIDREQYEAAEIDGAGPLQSFWYVTMAHLFNLSVVLWILMTIWSVNDFDTPFLLTGGGPSNATENLIVLTYRYTFRRNDVGMGTATAFVTLIILLALALALLRRQRQTN